MKVSDILKEQQVLIYNNLVDVVNNPSPQALLRMLANQQTFKELRGLIKGNNSYWWISHFATHFDIEEVLEIPKFEYEHVYLRNIRSHAVFKGADSMLQKEMLQYPNTAKLFTSPDLYFAYKGNYIPGPSIKEIFSS